MMPGLPADAGTKILHANHNARNVLNDLCRGTKVSTEGGIFVELVDRFQVQSDTIRAGVRTPRPLPEHEPPHGLPHQSPGSESVPPKRSGAGARNVQTSISQPVQQVCSRGGAVFSFGAAWGRRPPPRVVFVVDYGKVPPTLVCIPVFTEWVAPIGIRPRPARGARPPWLPVRGHMVDAAGRAVATGAPVVTARPAASTCRNKITFIQY